MHDNIQDDDDYKLPLRPWLKNHIERKTFEGLEWINAKEQIFKIPWTKKGHPGWEKDYEVFKCWAIHRGKYDETAPPDYNRWKGNFRSVLHKSEDFREIKEKSITNQQTGNYRVFQILPSSEVKENRKRPRSSADETPSAIVVTKQKKQPAVTMATTTPVATEPVTSSLDQSSGIRTFDSSFNQPSTTPLSEFESINYFDPTVCLVTTSNIPADMPGFPSTQLLPPQSNSIDLNCDSSIESLLPTFSLSEVQQCLDSDPADALPGTTIELLQPNEHSFQQDQGTLPALFLSTPLTSVAPKEVSTDSSKLSEFLEKKNVSKDQLTKILLTVQYGKDVSVYQEQLDLSHGCRLLYGNASQQAIAVASNGRKVDDLSLPTKELPPYTGDNLKIEEILKHAELGLVFTANESGIICAKRLCQSRVWFLRNSPSKLERNSQIELFSYSKYIDKILSNSTDLLSSQVNLTIGEKPPCPTIDLIKIILEPILAPFIEHYFSKGNPGGASGLYSSEESSIERLIRKFADQSVQN